GREPVAILVPRRAADHLAESPRQHASIVRELVRRDRDGVWADRIVPQHRADPALRADQGRRAAQPQSRIRAGAGHDRDHRVLESRLYIAAPSQREVDAMRQPKLFGWLAVAFGAL